MVAMCSMSILISSLTLVKRNVVSANHLWKWIATCLLVIASQAIITANGQEKICVIGGGMGGSCTAYFIHNKCGGEEGFRQGKGEEEGKEVGEGLTCEVHVFEKSDSIGGRISPKAVGNQLYDVGDSVAINSHRHVLHFAELFNLTKQMGVRERTRFGIFNGKDFTFKEGHIDGCWKYLNRIRQLWRYGFGVFTAKSFVKHVVNSWHLLQDSLGVEAYYTVAAMLHALDLQDISEKSLAALLRRNQWVYNITVDEILSAATGARSGQSPRVMHGIAGGLMLATAFDLQSWTLIEGFWTIPRILLERSGATVHLNAEVKAVSRTAHGGYTIQLASNESAECSAVIIAAPIDGEETIHLPKSAEVPRFHWKQLHVTYVQGLINPAYFGMAESAGDLPTNIATLNDLVLPFLYLSYANASVDDAGLFVYRVLSKETFSDGHVDAMFRSVRNVQRFTWKPYVEFRSPAQLGTFLLDDHHLYYANALESVFGGMEMAAVAADNVVRLMLERMGFGEMEPESMSDPTSVGRGRSSLRPYLATVGHRGKDRTTPRSQGTQGQTEADWALSTETEPVTAAKHGEKEDNHHTIDMEELQTNVQGGEGSLHTGYGEKDEL